jgi:hypothetical protein
MRGATDLSTIDFSAGTVFLFIWTAQRRWCGWIWWGWGLNAEEVAAVVAAALAQEDVVGVAADAIKMGRGMKRSG